MEPRVDDELSPMNGDRPGTDGATEMDAGATREAAPDAIHRARGRSRSILAVGTGVLACLCLLASVIGVWTYRTVFDTDAWVDRIADLPTQPAFADALATRLADDLFAVASV